jgi:membrane protease YdiL (CAAX protease family)
MLPIRRPASRLGLLFAACLSLAGTVVAGTPSATPQGVAEPAGTASARVVDLHDADSMFARMGRELEAHYVDALAEYDAAIAHAPADAALAVARCELIDDFVDAEDVLWTDRAQADSEACRTRLAKRWPAAPLARVYLFEHLDDEDALDASDALWRDATRWPGPVRRRLAVALHRVHDGADAEDFAIAGARLGAPELVAPAVVALRGRGKEVAAAALASHAPLSESTWQAGRRLQALLKLKDKEVAARELRRTLAAGVAVDSGTQVAVHVATGDLRAADAALARASARDTRSAPARFDLALARGRIGQAAALVDIEDDVDVWMPRYARIAAASPGALLMPTLWMPLAVVLVLLGALALAPGLALFPVHYRGLVRRARNRPATPLFQEIGLRHAWIGAALALVVPFVAAVLAAPAEAGDLLSGASGSFDAQAIASIALLACLAFLLPRFGRAHLVGSTESPLRTLRLVFLAWLCVAATWAVIAGVHRLTGEGFQATEQTRMVEALSDDGLQRYGLMGLLAMLAVLTPIVEELVFRGLLLGGLSRHLSFGWANAVQSGVFALVHVDSPRLLGYFALALLAGWLVRRTGSLWPAMLLHALNNAVATMT